MNEYEILLTSLLNCGSADLNRLMDLINNTCNFTGLDYEAVISDENTFYGLAYEAIIQGYNELQNQLVDYICDLIEDCIYEDVLEWVNKRLEDSINNIYINYLDIDTGSKFLNKILLCGDIEEGLESALEYYYELYQEEIIDNDESLDY